jgi:DNA anti-recombination protein RmuC
MKEYTMAREDSFKARMDAMDKAILLTEKFPTAIDTAIAHLKESTGEKFIGVIAAINANKEQITQRFQLNDEQVKTALASAKELVEKQNEFTNSVYTKSENNFRSELSLLSGKVDLISKTEDDKIDANAKTSNEKIEDIRTRLTTIESLKKGGDNTIGWFFGGLIAIYSLVATIVAIFEFIHQIPVNLAH